jgi:hypothetical protein
VGAVLVHIDLGGSAGERPHPSSIAALAAGRAIASSWGATLYAAIVVHDTSGDRAAPDSTAQVVSTRQLPGIEAIQSVLASAGADKVIVALTDAPIAPLWAAVGAAWQGVLDHLRPRLVLFGADAPSAAELGPRTGARIGARLLQRARATGGDQVELRDRDGGFVRASDGGAAVALIGTHPTQRACDDDIDLVVLVVPGGADPRIELADQTTAEVAHTVGAIVAISDDAAADAETAAAAQRLAKQLGAPLLGGPNAIRAGVVAPEAVVDRQIALAPELCVAVGSIGLDLAGATSLVRIGPSSGKGVEGVLELGALRGLTRALDDEASRG